MIVINEIWIEWGDDSDVTQMNAESCRAGALVSYPLDQYGNRRLETLSSGGLYGIVEPSDEYRAEIESEQLNELHAHLQAFNVDVSTFGEHSRNIKRIGR